MPGSPSDRAPGSTQAVSVDLGSELRVRAYVTLLCTLALSTSIRRASTGLEQQVRDAWRIMSKDEQARAVAAINAPKRRTRCGHEHLRLVDP